MKSKKAQDVFPKSLLDEIQKYVHGELVYIPKRPNTRKKWGADTGAKRLTECRNNDMLQAFKDGMSVEALAIRFCLSEETVKKIVYGK